MRDAFVIILEALWQNKALHTEDKRKSTDYNESREVLFTPLPRAEATFRLFDKKVVA